MLLVSPGEALPKGVTGLHWGCPQPRGVGVGGFPTAPYPGGAQPPLPHSCPAPPSPRTCGFFLGRPRPLFSDTSFSPLEARGWLDLALDSLIVCPSSGEEEWEGGMSVSHGSGSPCQPCHPLALTLGQGRCPVHPPGTGWGARCTGCRAVPQAHGTATLSTQAAPGVPPGI